MRHGPRLSRTLSLKAFAIATVMALLAVVVPASAAQAAALPSSIVEGGYLISDAEFYDSDALTAAQIQKFLNSKVTTCKATTGPTCLKSFTAKLTAKKADSYCKAISAKTKATAAQIIAAVATACGINPKVILVMLQKEQGLVTDTSPVAWSYRAAMGQSCPDTAPCDAAAAGFVNQVYLGARQFQVYTKNPDSYGYKAGQVNTIKWAPSSSCGTSKVYIQNQATANLYIYTPYRPNVAALAAGYGLGDSCSAYGNRNFYNYYVDWFDPDASSSTGAPALISACTVPASADIASASTTATVKKATTAQKAPTTKCTTGTTSLKKGATVTVTGTYGAWARIKVGSAKRWVLKSTITMATTASTASTGDVCAIPSDSSITAASGTVVVTTSVLNARKAPSTSCDTGKKQLSMGATATRTGIYGSWWRITLSGSSYWIHSDYADVQTASTTAATTTSSSTTSSSTSTSSTTTSTTTTVTKKTTTAVNLRAKASTSAKIIKVLAKGTKVTVVASSGGWRKVKVGSSTGWVYNKYLKTVTYTKKTTTAVNLRAKASTSAKIIKVLAKGTKVTVVAANGKWRKVKVGSKTGWVHSSYLT
ncbi:MAG: SH3 domain-containing protein [Microbacterium sp.]